MPGNGVAQPPPIWAALTAYALLVAVLLTLCDWAGHVVWDTLIYNEPDAGSLLPGQPTVRVFLGFVGLSVPLTVVGWRMFGTREPPSMGVTVTLLATFLVAYLISGPLDGWPMVLSTAFMLGWSAQLAWFTERLYPVVLFSVLLAVVGPIAEGLYSATGFFDYSDDAVFGVPAWLGPLYLNGALAVVASMAVLGRWLGRSEAPKV